ncbi:hypothetical protein BGW38_005922 [Lunasporangiospora selenospora]|uniref:Sds3-like-domain-containing protein n=1 Tax=Lunasporangiospora selenospora TaxID=979761 RepID=A0A9P6G1I2_9FUNG|nr:hypothetical protein BGW38_005922 [Lunasporangiospora selenospora]
MLEVASLRTDKKTSAAPPALSDMKNNKDKAMVPVKDHTETKESDATNSSVSSPTNTQGQEQVQVRSTANDAENSHDPMDTSADGTRSPSTKPDEDEDMRGPEEDPASIAAQETETPEMESVSPKSNNGMGQAISQEDLDGGLLDGALDDYDMDQDTEDTEVGNGEDGFSDEDDEDEDDEEAEEEEEEDNDNEEEERAPKRNNKSSHARDTPDRASPATTSKSEDHDFNTHEDSSSERQTKGSRTALSDDSDSDLPEPDGSDNEEDEDEEDEEEDEEDADADAEDGDDKDIEDEGDDEEDEPPSKSKAIKKDIAPPPPPPQKPVLNRPSATEEELKDSGDDLSELSDFEDSDDSDEDEHISKANINQNDNSKNGPISTPTSSGNNKASASMGGRKRSLQEDNKESDKKELLLTKPEQEEEDNQQIPNGRSRQQSDSPERKRNASGASGITQSDKETESETHEEDAEKAVDDEEEDADAGEEEDAETKQLHKDALEALTSIEVEFASLRDKMYEERMLELEKEVEMIHAGTHPELTALMQEIEHKREQRLRVADMGKKYKKDIAQHEYDIAEYNAHCTYQSGKRNSRVDMMRTLGRKQRQLKLELDLSTTTYCSNAISEKSALVRSRKYRRIEANELKIVNEHRGFPASAKPGMVTNAELDHDFEAMEIPRPVQHRLPIIEHESHMMRSTPGPHSHHLPPQQQQQQQQQHHHHLNNPHHPPSIPVPPSNSSSTSSSARPTLLATLQSSIKCANTCPREVEIFVDGPRCMIDNIWYHPNDSVVVLDASIGKYHAKYLYLASDEIMLQRMDGSKTRLHLGLFKGRKLCMQPKP